jgi:PHD/YefM family antitoxin component YafN of YafNO toxin-antitoxin module
MIATPQMEPVSTLAKNHKSVFAKLVNGPVWLAARSRPTAVLVAVEEWDYIANKLEALQDQLDVLEAEYALKVGATPETVSREELQGMIDALSD